MASLTTPTSQHDPQKWMQIIVDHEKLADDLILEVQERAKCGFSAKCLSNVHENCLKFLEEVTRLEAILQERVRLKRQLSSNKLEAKIILADFKKGLHNIESVKKKAMQAVEIVKTAVKEANEATARKKLKEDEIEVLKMNLESMKGIRAMRERHLRRQMYLAGCMEREKEYWRESLKKLDAELTKVHAERAEMQRKIDVLHAQKGGKGKKSAG